MAASSTLVLAIVVSALISSPVHAISCQDAVSKLLPCKQFLTGSGDISAPCCNGVQTLQQFAASKSYQKTTHKCLKQAAMSMEMISKSCKLCKISFPSTIDPNTDCDILSGHKVVHDGFVVNRYKNLEINAFRPTTPGKSPGIGHGTPRA